MRHGQTNWNVKRIIQGHSHNRLSRDGINQVEKKAKEHIDTKIDIIYTSPLMRTMQTTNIMNQYHNAKVIRDDRLKECDEGDFTGRKHSNMTEKENSMRDTHSHKYNMETWDDVYLRLKDFYQDILKNPVHENILVVTHDVCAIFLEDILMGRKTDTKNYAYERVFQNAELRNYTL